MDNLPREPDLTDNDTRREMWDTYSPIALFGSKQDFITEWNHLVPVAIQMDFTPGLVSFVFIQFIPFTTHTLIINYIKYLGIMIDDCVSWKYHISYICSQISRNIGIISKLRHYLSIKQRKQIYYNLIYPYIAYAILAWGSTYTSSLQKVQVKQNHVARLIFFANMRGKDTESALPLLNLLDMHTVYNIYSLHVLKFAHLAQRSTT